MHLASHRTLRRASIYGLLLALLGLAAVSLTQCTMVGDNVTGLSMSTGKPDMCLKDCKKAFDRATHDEFKLNQKNRKACGNDIVCLAIETNRHREALEQIEQDYTTCRETCHHQGGGGGR